MSPRKIELIFLLIIAVVLIQAPLGAEVHMRLEPAVVTATVHQPVIVTLTLWSTSGEAAEFRFSTEPVTNYFVTIRRPDGTDAVFEPRLVARFQGGETVGVAAGQPHVRTLLLNEWEGFDEAGTYVVQVRLGGSSTPMPFVGRDVEDTATVRVEVGPRDAGLLDAMCQKLYDVVVHEDRARNVYNAARTLSTIMDEVAASYMVRLLTDHSDEGVWSLALGGLERMAGTNPSAAVSALAQVMREGTFEAVRAAEGRLRSIQAFSKNAQARRMAEYALGNLPPRR